MEENPKLVVDGCSITFELPLSDSLFEKKKKLLKEKGFGIKEQVLVRGTFSPDSLTSVLEQMLQIARIIHLTEAELYFGEVDESGFYSYRNEMEALRFILLLVDSSLSSDGETYERVTQDLQATIMKRIHEFGINCKVKSKVNESYDCRKENCLKHWGEIHGLKTSLEIAYIDGAGRGAIATKDLEVGDIALEIPLSILISEELVQESDMYQVLRNERMSCETMLLLWSMKEKHNTNSKYRTYFDTLPEQFNTGLSFGVEAIMALDGTLLLDEIVQAKEILRSQYDDLIPLLQNHHDIFPQEYYTWEHFLWACELWYSNSMKIMFLDGKLRTCLIPVAGFLNYSLSPHILHYGKVDPVTNSLKFQLSRPCSIGEECFLSYGNFSSSHFISFYGFIPQGDNPNDVIQLDLFGDQADPGDEECPSTWETHMVRGTWLSKNHNIFHYGLPRPLLDHLRAANSTLQCTGTLSKLEIEKVVLEDLEATFSQMVENFGEIDSVDHRDDMSWDVKLAVEFKELQRKIVSSVATACSRGLELVEHELSKSIMESVYRMWMKERQRGLTPQESTDLCREVQITLGTTKWQLEEFEKAIRLSHSHRSNEITASRHKQFIAAIETQICRVETDLRESFVQEGKQPLRWVNLDERECDDLALFLSGPSLGLQTAKHNTHLENHHNGRNNDANLRTACDVVTRESRSCKDTTRDAESERIIELNDRASSGNKEDIIYQQTATTSTRKTWSSPNLGALVCGDIFDVIVIGGGVMGSSTAYHLAKSGHKTLLLEQFDFLHHRGSSHGESRTIRSTYPEDYYYQLVLESTALWEQAQSEIGYRVYFKTHHLDMGPSGCRSLQSLISTCKKHNSPHRVLDRQQVADQFGGRIDIPEDWIGVWCEHGGVIKPTKAVAMFQALALMNGAVLKDNRQVTCIRRDEVKGGITMGTSQGENFHGKKCVVTAGAWTTKLVEAVSGRALPIRALETSVSYWRILGGHEEKFTIESGFPTFASYGVPNIYGTPSLEYPGLIKVGVHGGRPCDPDKRPWSSGVNLEMLKKWIQDRFWGLVDSTHPVSTQLCMYSMSPDEDFMIDFVGGEFGKDVVVGGGFSGHGFKMAPAVGRILADLATKGEEAPELNNFSISRFDENPKGNAKEFEDQVARFEPQPRM